eukprot:TRINITY_DN35877_c0_g1_i1.p1 TRINITY_DN35877_c0_g1~~TRINITY_DN35877_c0_g1_i1.p1  ORF type:complete len:462 (-),score=93.80 TRINITY_DN35877_c0_g1_i1:55-1440(-)
MAFFSRALWGSAAAVPVACTAAGALKLNTKKPMQTCCSTDEQRRPPLREKASVKPKLTCFGEAMIRYVPDPDGDKIPLASQFASRWLRNAGGAELNLTVALSRLDWGGRARWVSVVPEGALGDDFLELLGQAYPDGSGKENLKLVRRKPGDVGIYHVWPSKHKIWFQRHRSVFGLMDSQWFDRDFWWQILSSSESQDSLHILHLTGITPLISVNTRAAWSSALETARSLKASYSEESGSGKSDEGKLLVTFDLNHRPALGTWKDLWRMVEPHLDTLDICVFSIGDLIQVGEQFGAPLAEGFRELKKTSPPGIDGAAALDACVRKSLVLVQQYLGFRTNIAVTCKLREPAPSGSPRGTPPRQLRWSVACLKDGTLVSTFETAVEQWPREDIGGGDSWLSGVIDRLTTGVAESKVAPAWSEDMWFAAMQQGDMLAALKQQVVGDFSNVDREQLQSALDKHLYK